MLYLVTFEVTTAVIHYFTPKGPNLAIFCKGRNASAWSVYFACFGSYL